MVLRPGSAGGTSRSSEIGLRFVLTAIVVIVRRAGFADSPGELHSGGFPDHIRDCAEKWLIPTHLSLDVRAKT